MRNLIKISGVVALIAAVMVPGVATQVAHADTAKASCTNHLQVSIGAPQGAAGTSYYPIIFTNSGALSCQISGVPGLQAGRLSATHTFEAVGPPAHNNSMGMMGVLFTVLPHHAVSTLFGVTETGNYSPSRCGAQVAGYLRVSFESYVTTNLAFTRPISVCSKIASTSTRLIAAGALG